jgi:hypothetical protein
MIGSRQACLVLNHSGVWGQAFVRKVDLSLHSDEVGSIEKDKSKPLTSQTFTRRHCTG